MAGGAGGKGKTRGAAESFLCPAASVWQGEAALEKTCAEAGRALSICGMCCVQALRDIGGCKVAGAGGDARTGGPFFRA